MDKHSFLFFGCLHLFTHSCGMIVAWKTAKNISLYFSGKGSAVDLAAKHKISTADVLLHWVYMAEARRKTTLEERKEIVGHCISHDRDYKETASLYDASYSQVYSWVKKYDTDDKTGLLDRRGHHKTDDEVDGLERLRRENVWLKRQLEEREMTVELLKKRKHSKGCEVWETTLRIEIHGDSIFY